MKPISVKDRWYYSSKPSAVSLCDVASIPALLINNWTEECIFESRNHCSRASLNFKIDRKDDKSAWKALRWACSFIFFISLIVCHAIRDNINQSTRWRHIEIQICFNNHTFDNNLDDRPTADITWLGYTCIGCQRNLVASNYKQILPYVTWKLKIIWTSRFCQ